MELNGWAAWATWAAPLLLAVPPALVYVFFNGTKRTREAKQQEERRRRQRGLIAIYNAFYTSEHFDMIASSEAGKLESERRYVKSPADEDHCYVCLEVMPPRQSEVNPPLRVRNVCCGKECCYDCRASALGVGLENVEKTQQQFPGCHICGRTLPMNERECQKCARERESAKATRSKGRRTRKHKSRGRKPDAHRGPDEQERRYTQQVANALGPALGIICNCHMCRGCIPEDPEKVFALLLKHAERGAVWAIWDVANYYKKGMGVTANEERFVHWIKAGSAQGNPSCQFLLGTWHIHGDRGMPRDREKARRLFALSAENNDARAQFCYALMLYLGEGGNEDREEAFRFLAFSVVNGFRRSVDVPDFLAGKYTFDGFTTEMFEGNYVSPFRSFFGMLGDIR